MIEDREDQNRLIERFNKNINLLSSILLIGEESGDYKQAVEDAYLRSIKAIKSHKVRRDALYKEIGIRCKQ